jgi:tRNA pseudouridine55 synthase
LRDGHARQKEPLSAKEFDDPGDARSRRRRSAERMVRVAGRDADLHGVLVIDKPAGPTSHDVVKRLRWALGTRAVGHAGTLDPAASGVLVVAVGQGTKLVSYLTSQAKSYEATVTFGTSTTTLDREGEVVAAAPVPVELTRELSNRAWTAGSPVDRALARERTRREQVPPAFSAVKQNGRAVHERARRGEHVELGPRVVEVHALEIRGATEQTVDLRLSVSKGYYVRSLARDLGETLGVPAHLSALRRVASGPFTLDEALPHDAPRETLCRALEPVAQAAARVLPIGRVSAEGTERARRGQVLSPEHFDSPPDGAVSAWVDASGELIAIGRLNDAGLFLVARGFSHSTSSAAT